MKPSERALGLGQVLGRYPLGVEPGQVLLKEEMQAGTRPASPDAAGGGPVEPDGGWSRPSDASVVKHETGDPDDDGEGAAERFKP